MNYRKKLTSISIIIILIFVTAGPLMTGMNPLGTVMAQDEGSSETYDALISDFEGPADEWSYGYGGGPGAQGSFEIVSGDAQQGAQAGKISADFSNGSSYVTMKKKLEKAVILRLAFWVKTQDVKNVGIRAIDSTGQVFQHVIRLESTEEWQRIAVDEMKSNNYWGGANDGQWHGPAKEIQILLSRNSINNGTMLGSLLIDNVTAVLAEPLPVTYDTLISNFEISADEWSYGYGDEPGVQGSFEIVSGGAYHGMHAGKLSADFSNGSTYVLMKKKIEQADIQELAFWVKTQDARTVGLRVIDSTGQIFQHKIRLRNTAEWQQVVVKQMASNHYWGGAGDGQWHGPAREIQILMQRFSINNDTNRGSLLIDEVTAMLKQPKLLINDTSISDFEDPADAWLYEYGDRPGVQGSFEIISGDTYQGTKAGKLSADFSNGSSYVAMKKRFEKAAILQLAFWVKTQGVKNVGVRAVDSTGQVFQHVIRLENTAEWQQVAVKEMKSDQYWGGANDGQWHGAAKEIQIVLPRASINNGSMLGSLLIDDVTAVLAEPLPVTYDTLISSFEISANEWSYGYGDKPGVQGSFEIVSGGAYQGTHAGKLSADFSNGSTYVLMKKKIEQADIQELAFWVKTQDAKTVGLRVIDSTGQIFQHEIRLRNTAEWQQVVVKQMASNHYWGGAGDGQWHGPAREIQILMQRSSINNDTNRGSMLIDEVTAMLIQPKLLINDTSISDFEDPADAWLYEYGDRPGVQGSFEIISGDTYQGTKAGKLSADFSNGSSYVAMKKRFEQAAILQLSFWVKTQDVKNVGVRAIDSTGQVFQHVIRLENTAEWQQVAVKEMKSDHYWGGTNDGQWHGPAKEIQILLQRNSINNSTMVGSLLIDDVTAVLAEPLPVTYDTLISDFENSADIWSYGYGDVPGVQGSFEIISDDTYKGTHGGKLSADFSNGSTYVVMKKRLERADIQELAFWVKTQDAKTVGLRVIDSTGQIFQHEIRLRNTAEWQQVVVKQMASNHYWGGAGDGQWHGPAREIQILMQRSSINNDTKRGSMLIDEVTALLKEPLPYNYKTLISDFETSVNKWSYGYGDEPGVQGSFETISGAGYQGTKAGQLSADFSNGSSYVKMMHSPNEMDILQLAFWVKTQDAKAVALRTIDATGQTFQHRFRLEDTGDWQQITVDKMKSDHYWGGAGDGRWHGPTKEIQFILNRNDIKSVTKQGSLLIDDVTATVKMDDLKFYQTELGNVYIDNEPVKFLVETKGDRLDWEVTDYWGKSVTTGTIKVNERVTEITPEIPDNGYYELNITALMNGNIIKKRTTSFAVIPKPLDVEQSAESPFGVVTHFRKWSTEAIPLIQKAGIKHIRDEMYWSIVEKEKGIYQYPSIYEKYTSELKEHGIDPLIVYAYNNPLYDGGYTPYTDNGREAFADYGKSILNQYEGQVKSVEVYNEFSGNFSTGPAKQNPEYYYKLLKETYSKVKANHPDVQVVGLATSHVPLDWIEEVFKQDNGEAIQYMDAISVHPYRHPNDTQGMDKEIALLNRLVQKYNNGQKKPIWVTEWGWTTNQGAKGVSETTQAAYFVQSAVRFLSEGVERMYWYDFINDGTNVMDPEHNFGIIRNEKDEMGKYAPKPAYAAYANMSRELTGASFTNKEAIGYGIASYLFQKNGESLRVLWSNVPTSIVIKTDHPIIVTDIVGHKKTLQPNEGIITHKLTSNPVYMAGSIDEVQKAGQ
ncbi:glycosyl hydrolase [Paenibacillus tarimensis]